jgi:hypothetical protein
VGLMATEAWYTWAMRPGNRPGALPQSTALYALWAIQGFDNGRLEIGACLGVKNIGKPCAGKPHARFDEGGQLQNCSLLYPFITVRSFFNASLAR